MEPEQEPEQEMSDVVDRDGDVKMSDGMEAKPKPKPRKKKEKKVVPVGHNGLKKRCVMKSRMRIDEKGYMGMSLNLLHCHFCLLSMNGSFSDRMISNRRLFII